MFLQDSKLKIHHWWCYNTITTTGMRKQARTPMLQRDQKIDVPRYTSHQQWSLQRNALCQLSSTNSKEEENFGGISQNFSGRRKEVLEEREIVQKIVYLFFEFFARPLLVSNIWRRDGWAQGDDGDADDVNASFRSKRKAIHTPICTRHGSAANHFNHTHT
jgi:hypothetical protein